MAGIASRQALVSLWSSRERSCVLWLSTLTTISACTPPRLKLPLAARVNDYASGQLVSQTRFAGAQRGMHHHTLHGRRNLSCSL